MHAKVKNILRLRNLVEIPKNAMVGVLIDIVDVTTVPHIDRVSLDICRDELISYMFISYIVRKITDFVSYHSTRVAVNNTEYCTPILLAECVVGFAKPVFDFDVSFPRFF